MVLPRWGVSATVRQLHGTRGRTNKHGGLAEGRVTKNERYYDADDDESFPTDGTVDGGDRLLARTENLYDKLGRVYRTKTYAVDTDDGTVGDALVSDTWRDDAGRTIKQQSGGSKVFSKTAYDGLGGEVDVTRSVTPQFAADGRGTPLESPRDFLLICSLMPQLRYPITLFHRKMMGHRRDSVPKGVSLKHSPHWNFPAMFFPMPFFTISIAFQFADRKQMIARGSGCSIITEGPVATNRPFKLMPTITRHASIDDAIRRPAQSR